MKKLLIVLVLVLSAFMPITAKAKAQASITPFHFVFTADSRDDYTVLPVLSRKMVTLSPAFGFFGGDLCGSFDVNCINNTWKPALDGNNSDGILAKTFVSRGNHDNGSITTWQGLWDFQGMAAGVGATNYTALVSDATYSFDYSNTHFSVIDLPGGGSSSWTSAEISWLDTDLTAAEGRGVKHEFIFAHGPMYGVTSQHGSETPSAALKAVLNKHPISAGFHGHEHVTAYTDVTPSREAGINNYQQFTLGRAGAPAYTVAKPVDWSANQNAFADVFVNGNDFTVTIYGQSGSALFTKTFTDSAGTPVPATATTVPPTATNVPPTATKAPATATAVPPTATALPPTGTNVPPTATRNTATATQTVVPPTFTNTPLPGITATSTNPPTATKPSTLTSTPNGSLTFPLRLAFYYPWFPEAWNQLGISPYTNYHPSLGSYDSSNQATIKTHIAAMQYGGIQGGIASWWGQGSATDSRIPALLQGAAGTAWQWSIYYEPESLGDPSVAQLTSDLTYLHDHYAGNPNFLKIGGRFVVFVYADTNDGCGMADRWKQANTVNAYVVLKVFAGYKSCASQPDGWHQYSPAVAADSQAGYSYAISPGFWKAGESARLVRDLTTWNTDIRNMIASNAPFQLVTTFNEWGEGTAIESASEWNSASGYGAYLDALHNNGQALPPPSSTPAATATTVSSPTPTSSPAATIVPTTLVPPATSTATTVPASPTSGTSTTTRFLPSADAYTDASNPTVNTGSLTQIRIDNSPVVKSYLRFVIQGLSGNVTKATLRVYANSSSTAGYQVYKVADTSWGETTIMYNNAPALGGMIGSMGAFSGGAWTTVDVTSMISGNGTFSLALTDQNNTAISFVSRDGGANAPQLEVTVNGAAASPTTSPSSTPTATETMRPTISPSSTPTATQTMSPTNTPTPTFTSTPVPTNTPTATAPATATATQVAIASPTSSVSTVVQFSPSADSYTDASSPSTNKGTLTQFRIDNSPVVNSYLRFDVQGLSGRVTNAILRVYANSSSSAGYQLYGIPDTSWGETTLTYNNAPPFGSQAGSMGAFNASGWTSVDVTPLITGNGSFSFALTGKSSTAVSFASRESGANAPQLVITAGGAASSPTVMPPSITPTSTHAVSPTATPTQPSTTTPTPSINPTQTSGAGDPIIFFVSDLVSSGSLSRAKLVVAEIQKLMTQHVGTQMFVASMGDNEQENNPTVANYQANFGTTYGTFVNQGIFMQIRGNHDIQSAGSYSDYNGTVHSSGGAYWTYFGANAHDNNIAGQRLTDYSYNLGGWHLVGLDQLNGSVNTATLNFLKSDLAANPGLCQIVYWHVPTYSSGSAHGDSTGLIPLNQAEYDAGVDIQLNGHDHDYQRFNPINPSGILDVAKGITTFITGIGGEDNRTGSQTSKAQAASAVYFDAFPGGSPIGTLQLTLHATSADYALYDAYNGAILDQGTVNCH